MSAQAKLPAPEADAFMAVRGASVVAQLRAIELHRQLCALPDPLTSLAAVEAGLAAAAELGDGFTSADLKKLQADLGAFRRVYEAQATRQSRECRLWRELFELLRKLVQ